MKVKVFLQSCNDIKFMHVLQDFALGIAQYDSVEVTGDKKYSDCDCAVFFGSWKDWDATHHNIKRDIVRNAPQFIVLETPLLGRQKVENIMQDDWYRIGANGFLRDTGNFNNINRPSDRWEKISHEFNLIHTGWNTYKDAGPIVVALQLPGDASLKGINITQWAWETCFEIRKHTDKDIWLRTPQLDRQFDPYYMKMLGNMDTVQMQKGTRENLFPTLRQAYCTVTFSSGLAIDSVLNGCPTIACNTSNFAYDISSKSVEDINHPLKKRSIYKWLNNLAYCQWKTDEIKQGLPWVHLREVLND